MANDNWTKTRLGDLVEIKHGWPFKSELFSEELTGRPIVVNIGNFRYTGGFRFDSTTSKEYRGDYPAEYELKPGEILLVMTCQTSGGEILGIPARVPDDGKTYLHNQRLGRVVIRDSAQLDDRYLYWLFLWPEFNRELFVTATGTKILHTAPGRIESFQFQRPPLPEQFRIGNILSALDDKIELNRRTNETLAAIARALFKSWFVDFDPVHAKAEVRQQHSSWSNAQISRAALPKIAAEIAELFPDRFEDSSLGPIPAGWKVQPFDEIAEFLNGLALQKYPATKGDPFLPVIKIAQLRAGNSMSADKASTDVPTPYVIEDGDLLFSWSGSLLVSIWCGGKGALNQHLFKVTSSQSPRWFLYEWLLEHLPAFQAIASAKATTMGHIQRHHLHAALVTVPDKPLLAAASGLFEGIFNRIVKNGVQSRTLTETLDFLLPNLLSGELSVSGVSHSFEVKNGS